MGNPCWGLCPEAAEEARTASLDMFAMDTGALAAAAKVEPSKDKPRALKAAAEVGPSEEEPKPSKIHKVKGGRMWGKAPIGTQGGEGNSPEEQGGEGNGKEGGEGKGSGKGGQGKGSGSQGGEGKGSSGEGKGSGKGGGSRKWRRGSLPSGGEGNGTEGGEGKDSSVQGQIKSLKTDLKNITSRAWHRARDQKFKEPAYND